MSDLTADPGDGDWKKGGVSGAHWGLQTYVDPTRESELLRLLLPGLPSNRTYHQHLAIRNRSSYSADKTTLALNRFAVAQRAEYWGGANTWRPRPNFRPDLNISVVGPETSGARIEIEGIAAKSVDTSARLNIVVRPGVGSGTWQIAVLNGHGEGKDTWSVYDHLTSAPMITSISPSGRNAGVYAFPATVAGSRFDSATTLSWNTSLGATAFAVMAEKSFNPFEFPQSTQGVTERPMEAGSQRAQRVDKTGWYALDVGHHASQGTVDIEFVPDNTSEHKRFTLKNSGAGGEQAAWVHFSEPGSLIVRASGAEPALRGMDYAEFISRSFDITLSKALLTVFLLADVLPLSAWILIVWRIRSFAYKKINALPRMERKHARHEVELMLGFAKWSGVCCYMLWTAKDILAGVGIIFAGG